MRSLDSANLSKRKMKLGRAKQAVIKNGVANKVVFDDDDNPHAMYEMADPDAWYAANGGLEGAQKEGQLFAKEENVKMRVADVIDKQEARDKKQEEKRKRKERDKLTDSSGAVVAHRSDEGGYLSPEFDLPEIASNEEGCCLPQLSEAYTGLLGGP